ncbi:MAG: hypothetical protein WBO84_08950 [Acidimicrobiia bacterium]
MDELIAQIMEKTGVTAEKAREMLGVTADWMKERLPDDVANQIGSIISGAGDAAGTATGAATGAAAAATGKAGDLWNTAKGTVSGLVQNDDQ